MMPLKNALLRPWRHDDAASLAMHANDASVAEFMRDSFPYPYLLSDAKSWLSKAISEKKHLLLAIEVDKKAVGGIGVIFKDDVYRLNAEIGFWIGRSYRNKGIVSECITAVTRYVFDATPVMRIYAEILEANKASRSALVKCGFFHEATLQKAILKNGILMDCLVYRLMKEPIVIQS